MIRKQLTISLQNKPGTMARVGQALAKAGVNIEALTVVENTEVGMVRVLVSDIEAARKVLDPMGIFCVVENVCVLTLANQPGALATLAAKVAREGINVNYMYGSAGGGPLPGSCLVVISASDLDRVDALAR